MGKIRQRLDRWRRNATDALLTAGVFAGGATGCLTIVAIVLCVAAAPTAFVVIVAVLIARMLGVDV